MDLGLKKLDRYIMKKFMSTFFIALILIIGIVIIFDISEKIDKFVSNEAPLKAVVFLSLIHISEPTRQAKSRMPSSA